MLYNAWSKVEVLTNWVYKQTHFLRLQSGYSFYYYIIIQTDVKFDCEPEDIFFEKLISTNFGLRLSEDYHPPIEGVGGMVVLNKSLP
jgi:hypothetical protein